MAAFLHVFVGWFGGLAALLVLTSATAYKTMKGRTWSPTAGAVVHAVCLGSLLEIAFVVDGSSGASDSWTFCVVVFAFGLLVSAATVREWRSRAAQVTTLAFAAAMATMHFADLTPVKPYRRLFDALRPGMTRAEVLAAAHREFPDGGRHPFPTIAIDNAEELHFILDLKDGRWDAEWVTAYLKDGAVVSKRYLAD